MAAESNLKDIVLFMMENRSFHHMLAFLRLGDCGIRVANIYSCPDSARARPLVTNGAIPRIGVIDPGQAALISD